MTERLTEADIDEFCDDPLSYMAPESSFRRIVRQLRAEVAERDARIKALIGAIDDMVQVTKEYRTDIARLELAETTRGLLP